MGELEPAALGLPIMTGPYTFNAEDIAEMLQDAGAAVQVEDTPSLAEAATRLLSDPALRKERGDAGRRFASKLAGFISRPGAIYLGALPPALSAWLGNTVFGAAGLFVLWKARK